MRLVFAFLACVFLVGCGSGGGSHSPYTPSPGGNGPVDHMTAYDGTNTQHSGIFASEGPTSAEFHTLDNRLVFSTLAFGDISVFPIHNSTGWHGTVTLSGLDYAVWFWPEMNSLNIAGIVVTNNAAAWHILPVVSNG